MDISANPTQANHTLGKNRYVYIESFYMEEIFKKLLKYQSVNTYYYKL